MSLSRRLFITTSLLAPAALRVPAAFAQDYPVREIHVICAYAPGTGADTLVRYLAEKLRVLAGKPMIVENKPGAGTSIAAQYVAHAKPDGYTLFLNPANGMAGNVYLYKNLGHDVINDFAPITTLVKLPFVLAVPPTSPAKSVAELIALVDEATGAHLRSILHHPEFQAIEAAWRAIYFLVRRLETDSSLKVYLLDVSREELAVDLTRAESQGASALHKILVEQTVHTPGDLAKCVAPASAKITCFGLSRWMTPRRMQTTSVALDLYLASPNQAGTRRRKSRPTNGISSPTMRPARSASHIGLLKRWTYFSGWSRAA